jgi:chorismate mutase
MSQAERLLRAWVNSRQLDSATAKVLFQEIITKLQEKQKRKDEKL